MSALRLAYVYCDDPACADQSPMEGGPGETVTHLRQSIAGPRGWRYSRGKDYCEEHADPKNRTTAATLTECGSSERPSQ